MRSTEDEMLHRVRRRISNLEESISVPISAERFLSRAHEHARRAGVSVQAAIGTLAQDLSDGEVDSIAAELEQLVFGADTAARDAAWRRAMMVVDEGVLRDSNVESLSVSAPWSLSSVDKPLNGEVRNRLCRANR
jgi:hypothetical protein